MPLGPEVAMTVVGSAREQVDHVTWNGLYTVICDIAEVEAGFSMSSARTGHDLAEE